MGNMEIEILLIEDNVHDAELAMRSLRTNDIAIKIIHLKDGVEALDFLFGTGLFDGRDINDKPKVILLDLKLPKINGLEVLERIKANPLTKKIPVVVLTSSNENLDVDRAYEVGANSYIVKPVDFDSFHKIVKNMGIYWLLNNETSN